MRPQPSPPPQNKPLKYAAPSAFFDDVYAAFQQAAAGDNANHYGYRIAGHTVHLHFAGDALIPRITPAFEHQRLGEWPGDTSSDLHIHLWDTASTGIPAPSPPWSNDEYSVRNEIKGWSNDQIHTSFHMGSGVLSVLNVPENRAIFWVRDASELPYYESGAPLLALLHWWLQTRGKLLLHAGAVGDDDGAVVLVGRGGSGKSSTCLQCAKDGLRYLADDYCVFEPGEVPRVHSLYRSGKVNGPDANLFPELQCMLSNGDKLGAEKALYFFGGALKGSLTASLPIRAVLLPRVMPQMETVAQPITPGQSLLALAPSTIFQLPEAGGAHFKAMGRLVQQVPSFVLQLGSDRAQIPVAIRDLLQRLTP